MSDLMAYIDTLCWWQVALLGAGVTLSVLTLFVFMEAAFGNRRELWEQAALRVERERWKAEALAARQPEILGYSWDLQRRVFNADGTVKRGYHVCDALRVYAAARKANGEE